MVLSDECINFTMMYVFVIVSNISITLWVYKTSSISFNSNLFDGKVNLVGVIRKLNFKIPNSFLKHRAKKKLRKTENSYTK